MCFLHVWPALHSLCHLFSFCLELTKYFSYASPDFWSDLYFCVTFVFLLSRAENEFFLCIFCIFDLIFIFVSPFFLLSRAKNVLFLYIFFLWSLFLCHLFLLLSRTENVFFRCVSWCLTRSLFLCHFFFRLELKMYFSYVFSASSIWSLFLCHLFLLMFEFSLCLELKMYFSYVFSAFLIWSLFVCHLFFLLSRTENVLVLCVFCIFDLIFIFVSPFFPSV